MSNLSSILYCNIGRRSAEMYGSADLEVACAGTFLFCLRGPRGHTAQVDPFYAICLKLSSLQGTLSIYYKNYYIISIICLTSSFYKGGEGHLRLRFAQVAN